MKERGPVSGELAVVKKVNQLGFGETSYQWQASPVVKASLLTYTAVEGYQTESSHLGALQVQERDKNVRLSLGFTTAHMLAYVLEHNGLASDLEVSQAIGEGSTVDFKQYCQILNNRLASQKIETPIIRRVEGLRGRQWGFSGMILEGLSVEQEFYRRFGSIASEYAERNKENGVLPLVRKRGAYEVSSFENLQILKDNQQLYTYTLLPLGLIGQYGFTFPYLLKEGFDNKLDTLYVLSPKHIPFLTRLFELNAVPTDSEYQFATSLNKVASELRKIIGRDFIETRRTSLNNYYVLEGFEGTSGGGKQTGKGDLADILMEERDEYFLHQEIADTVRQQQVNRRFAWISKQPFAEKEVGNVLFITDDSGSVIGREIVNAGEYGLIQQLLASQERKGVQTAQAALLLQKDSTELVEAISAINQRTVSRGGVSLLRINRGLDQVELTVPRRPVVDPIRWTQG